MTDEELPDRAELASAYLDGDLSADERARADADPATMALVDSYRSLHTTLADVPPASMSDRAAALAAGLSEYDALAPMRRLTPLSELEPRSHHRNRWVLGAAASIVVLIAVIAIAASGGSSNNNRTASEPRPAATTLPASGSTKAAGASTANTESAAPATAAPAGGGGSAVDKGTPTPINSPAALRQFAESTPAFAVTADSTAAATAAPTAAPACLPAGDTSLGYITFLNIPAFAVLDGKTGAIKALAEADCRQLISVSP
jgi:hypothetical protein